MVGYCILFASHIALLVFWYVEGLLFTSLHRSLDPVPLPEFSIHWLLTAKFNSCRLRSLLGIGDRDLYVGGDGAALSDVRHVGVCRTCPDATANPDVCVSLVACPDRSSCHTQSSLCCSKYHTCSFERQESSVL